MPAMSRSTEFIRKAASSRFNYWAGYVVNLSLVAWLLSQALYEGQSLFPTQWLACALSGFVLWTFLEYVLHRYVYHVFPSALSTGHNLHHDDPKALIGVPWYITTVILVGFYYGMASLFHPGKTGVVMGFMWLGYIGYCFVHHSVHHFDFKNSWFREVRKHHLIHHHAKEGSNWGIMTDFWDRAFRTKA